MAHTKPPIAPEVFLETIAVQKEQKHNDPMLDYQAAIGEIIKDNRANEQTRLKATAILSDLVCRDPAKANGEAVRRLAKFFIHGTSAAFKAYNPEPTMRTAFNALTGFISEGGIIGEGADKTEVAADQQKILGRVLETAPEYHVSATNMASLQKHMMPVLK